MAPLVVEGEPERLAAGRDDLVHRHEVPRHPERVVEAADRAAGVPGFGAHHPILVVHVLDPPRSPGERIEEDLVFVALRFGLVAGPNRPFKCGDRLSLSGDRPLDELHAFFAFARVREGLLRVVPEHPEGVFHLAVLRVLLHYFHPVGTEPVEEGQPSLRGTGNSLVVLSRGCQVGLCVGAELRLRGPKTLCQVLAVLCQRSPGEVVVALDREVRMLEEFLGLPVRQRGESVTPRLQAGEAGEVVALEQVEQTRILRSLVQRHGRGPGVSDRLLNEPVDVELVPDVGYRAGEARPRGEHGPVGPPGVNLARGRLVEAPAPEVRDTTKLGDGGTRDCARAVHGLHEGLPILDLGPDDKLEPHFAENAGRGDGPSGLQLGPDETPRVREAAVEHPLRIQARIPADRGRVGMAQGCGAVVVPGRREVEPRRGPVLPVMPRFVHFDRVSAYFVYVCLDEGPALVLRVSAELGELLQIDNSPPNRRQDDAEAQVVIATVRAGPVAARGAAPDRAEAPTPPALHAECAFLAVERVVSWGPTVEVGRVGVLAPLPDVAVHVEQTPGVRSLGADIACLRAGISLVPTVAVECIFVITKGVASRRSGPAGVLPFRLCGQAILIPHGPGIIARVEPFAERFRIVPRDLLDRLGALASFELPGGGAHHGVILALSDLVHAHEEVLGDAHFVSGPP